MAVYIIDIYVTYEIVLNSRLLILIVTGFFHFFRDEGKAECNVCGKTFARASQLTLHMNIHYLERPFRCDPCGVSFRTKGHLVKHRRSSSHDCKVSQKSNKYLFHFSTASTCNVPGIGQNLFLKSGSRSCTFTKLFI